MYWLTCPKHSFVDNKFTCAEIELEKYEYEGRVESQTIFVLRHLLCHPVCLGLLFNDPDRNQTMNAVVFSLLTQLSALVSPHSEFAYFVRCPPFPSNQRTRTHTHTTHR